MCGIHGVFALKDRAVPAAVLHERMGGVTRHRGPDDHGSYSAPGILLGMRRLSIIDLAGGHQPIANEDQSIWVVCNGEIYNFRELRARLTRLGHEFSTASDTEVIVHAYEQYGDKFIHELEGMYGFALWDERRRRLLLGRDRIGVKPLYYHLDDDRVVFASEAKAILEMPGFSAEIDPAALSEYLHLGYVPCPLSMFRGINKVPPASLMLCDANGCNTERYWRLPADLVEGVDERDWARAVREHLEKAVVSQMVSDVPLGAFLSGGIDSSGVVAFMSKHSSRPVKTYSIGFGGSTGGGYYNELPFARRIVETFRTDHREIIVEPNVAALLPKLLWHMDEPMADAALITTYLVAEFARQDVTVILSGVGGDELFGGYRRYLGEYYGRYYNLLPEWLRRHVLSPIAERLPSDRHSPLLNLSRHVRAFLLANDATFEERYRSYIQVFGKRQRNRILKQAIADANDPIDRAFDEASGDELRRMFCVDMATQLPGDLLMLTDKMSMAVSLECRVPFLDHHLVELAGRMPSPVKVRGQQLKYVLKRALHGVLPADILHRRKRGFGAPMGAWMKNELSRMLKSVLSPESIERRGLLNASEVAETIRLHEESQADNTDHLMSLLNLELWCRMYLDGESAADVSEYLQAL